MRALILVLALVGASADAFAQAPAPAPVAAPDRYDVYVEVAPQWATPTPFDYDTITDATAVTLTLDVKQKLLEGLNGKLSMGPSVRLDSDEDDPDRGSSFGASVEISTEASKGFSAFGSFGYKALFTDVFEDDNGNERSFSGGGRYKYVRSRIACDTNVDCPEAQKFEASIIFNLSDSSDALRDHSSVQARAAFRTPVRWWAWFDIEGTAGRRWFENIDPMFGTKQRRNDWAVTAGIDFAPGLRTLLRMPQTNSWLRKVKLGYTYLERNSNFAGMDKTSGAPSLALVIGKAF